MSPSIGLAPGGIFIPPFLTPDIGSCCLLSKILHKSHVQQRLWAGEDANPERKLSSILHAKALDTVPLFPLNLALTLLIPSFGHPLAATLDPTPIITASLVRRLGEPFPQLLHDNLESKPLHVPRQASQDLAGGSVPSNTLSATPCTPLLKCPLRSLVIVSTPTSYKQGEHIALLMSPPSRPSISWSPRRTKRRPACSQGDARLGARRNMGTAVDSRIPHRPRNTPNSPISRLVATTTDHGFGYTRVLKRGRRHYVGKERRNLKLLLTAVKKAKSFRTRYSARERALSCLGQRPRQESGEHVPACDAQEGRHDGAPTARSPCARTTPSTRPFIGRGRLEDHARDGD
ncbi:hypothetical protein C8J57DRAFT_1521773 [Mycena rebaudengoi]|nr:hypothetical protein C8J57DRAFT_1521773 [Mycena rebaudengoi]